jgi:hypothetical protein
VSYAVTWRESGTGARSGKLTLGSSGLRLEFGRSQGSFALTRLRYADIAAAEMARSPGERIFGRPTVVLRRRSGAPMFIAGVIGPGFAGELVDHIQKAISANES